MNKTTKRILSVVLTVLIAIGIPFAVNAVDSATYTVTLNQDSRVKYSNVQKPVFEIKENAYRSVYAKSSDADYYIDSVSVTPAQKADVSYNIKTGEIFIENVSSDITLTPVLKEKTAPNKISVKWELADSGNYDEENPAAYVKFTAAVTDSEGEPVVNAKVSLKADESDKSNSTASLTDRNGTAELKHSYSLGEHTAVITSGSAAEKVSFNVVQQKKSDLELYTYQVQASLKNTKTGSVKELNPLYEYYTAPLHQAAIVVGAGEWVTPENDEINNLAPGQYGLRFKEYVKGDTIYLHSDYDYFTIDRAEWTIKADKDNSENVTFANDELYAAPGGDVFYYVTPDKGYEITEYSVDKPSYVRALSYNADGGYVKLSGVTGSVKLTVKAVKEENSEAESADKISAKLLSVKSNINALSALSAEEGLRIVDVYQDIEATNEGTQISVVIKNDAAFSSGNLPTLYYKYSTASKYSSVNSRYLTVNDDGTVTGYFTISALTSSTRIYDAYAEFNGEKTEHITLNLTKKPSIAKTDLIVTNEKGDRENGTITVNKADYKDGRFIYNKQSSSKYFWSDTNVITGLEHGTWFVYVAPYFVQTDDNTYTVQVRSSSASASVGQDDDDVVYYTVKFVNAAGVTVSEKEYEEGTKASSVTVPSNTADYTDGNKIYSYSWEEISDVTSDKVYTEKETVTVKKTAKIAITNIYQNNADGNYLSFDFSLADEDGSEIENTDGVKVYIDGNATRGSVNGSTFVGTAAVTKGTHTVYAAFGNDDYVEVKSGEVTVNLTKAEKPGLSQTPDTNAGGIGTITITSPYSKFVYYRQGDSETETESKLIEGLRGSNDSHVSALYYVYVPNQRVDGDADYNLLIKSDKATITVENIEVEETTEAPTEETEETTEVPTEETTAPTEAPSETESAEPVTEAPKKPVSIEVSDVYLRENNNADGIYYNVKVKAVDENGNPAYENVDGYYVTLQYNKSSVNGRLNENGEVEFTITLRSAGAYNLKAYFNGTEYESAESETLSVNIVKPDKPVLEAVGTKNDKDNGTIIISSGYSEFRYYREGASSEIPTDSKLISGLSKGTYYVYIPAQGIDGEADYNFLLPSDKSSVKVENKNVSTFTVTTSSGVELTLPDYTENGDLEFNDVVTLRKDGATAWKIGNTIVAYGDTYSFRVSGDITVTPVEDSINEQTTASIVSTYKATDTHQVRYQANFVVADGYEVVEHGFVYGKNINNDQLSLENVGKTGEYNGSTESGVIKKFTFTDGYLSNQAVFYYGIKAQSEGDKASAIAYIIVKDSEGNEETVYSNVASYIYA